MKKERFLGQLEFALGFLKEDEREATINYYSEMIDDRMEDGLTEEEAVSQMEKPEIIVSRLQKLQDGVSAAEGGEAASSEEKQAEEALRDAFAQCKDGVREAVKSVKDAVKGIGSVEATVTIDGDRIVGNWEEKRLETPAADIKQIEINSDNLPIKLTKSENDNITLTYFTSEYDPYSTTCEGGKLLLTHPGFSIRKDVFGHISDMMNDLAQMFSGKPTSFNGVFIDLTVPNSFNGEITLVGSNARVRVDDVALHAGLTLVTSNGRISLDDVACDYVDAKTSNARITLNDVKTRSFIKLKSTNGKLELKDSTAFGAVEMVTSNGAVNVESISSDDILLKTSNGAISGSIKGQMGDYAITSRTSNGHNNLPDGTNGAKKLSVKTSNGSIRVAFE